MPVAHEGLSYLSDKLLVGKVPLLGHLPGDIRIQRGSASCFFPLATMIVLSVLLTAVLNIILRLLRK